MFKYELSHPDIREGIKKLCDKFDADYWQKCDRENSYPLKFVNELSDAGYLSALIPEKFGGLGLPISAGSAILEEIHRSGGNAAACHAQMYTMGTLLRHGSEAQKNKYLPDIASGNKRLQAFGVTEPNSGTDTTSLQTTARLEGNTYYINGQKIWTSRAEYSDLILLLAKSDNSNIRKNNLSLFLIDMRPHLNKSIFIKPIKTMNHIS